MLPLVNPGGSILSSPHHCSLSNSPIQTHLFSPNTEKNTTSIRHVRPLNSTDNGPIKPSATSSKPIPFGKDNANSNPISFMSHDNVPLEGVIQFEKPDFTSRFNKWSRVAVLAGGDVAALLLFSAIGRFIHGFPIFDYETFRTVDPFIAGWFLSAYFLGGYGDEGRGVNGRLGAVIAAAKSWAFGILVLRANHKEPCYS